MMKNLIKKNKGVSLISLVITVAVILILTNVVVYNAADTLKTTKLSNMQADIENLRDRVSTYYAQYGMIPADTSIAYTNTSHINSISEATDIGPFYVIDLAAMENVTLNYGKDYEKIRSGQATTQDQINQLTDLYIINGTSHNIFYVDGIESGDETFYTDYSAEDKDTVAVEMHAQSLPGEIIQQNRTFKDSLENQVTVPAGFKVINLDDNVEDGIVIEDSDGNQFVWIPVGTYQTTNGAKTNNLTRRNFITAGPVEISGDSLIGSYYYGEGNSNSTIYGTEYSIDKFKTSAENYKGFYIGRYESGCEANRTSVNDTLGELLIQKGLYPYTYVKKSDAIKLSQDMYKDNSAVKSTLISSYAWDTALNFICQNSEYGYKLSILRTGTEYANICTNKRTNTGEYENDCYSNIYDFLGNVYEWTTEYSSDKQYESVFRGNGYNSNSTRYPALRDYSTNDLAYGSRGFRVELYLQ